VTFVAIANNATALIERVAGWMSASPGNVVVTPEPATVTASSAGPVVHVDHDVVRLIERVRLEIIHDGKVIETREA
jgi:hypothetical protein